MTQREWVHGAGVLLRVGCWLGIAALAMCALARIFSYDHHRIFTLINANTFWLYLPAYVVAFGALWFQRWLLAACAIVLVVLHMVWVFPGFMHGRAVPASAARRAVNRRRPELPERQEAARSPRPAATRSSPSSAARSPTSEKHSRRGPHWPWPTATATGSATRGARAATT